MRLTPMPPWLNALAKEKPSPARDPARSSSDVITEGRRNDVLFRAAAKLRRAGSERAEIVAGIEKLNSNHCSPPLRDDELQKIADSATTYPSIGSKRRLEMKPASQYEPRSVKFLWKPWIPLGKITLLVGMPGLGKSSVAFDVAARVSRRKSRTVLIFSSEDDANDTIVPRLIAADADLDRILLEVGVVDEHGLNAVFNLHDHIEALEERVARDAPALVVFDPLSAYVGGIDSHRESEVRQLLRTLRDLAEKYRFAVLSIAHLNKTKDVAALHRVGGSGAFAATARSIIGVVASPDTENRSVMGVMKSNVAKAPAAREFSLDPILINCPVPPLISTSIVTWYGDRDDVSVTELLESHQGSASAVEAAIGFLRDELKDGAIVKQKMVESDAKAAGHSVSALRRAKQKLGVVSRRVDNAWTWSLP